MLWLIFIDTNILLDFYRLGGESASRQLNALERHKDAIITCDQVRMVSEEDETEEDKIVSEVPIVLYRIHLVDILLGREPDKAVGKELFERFFPEVTPVQD